MGKYTTKYFGEISIDETKKFGYIKLEYNGQELHVSFPRYYNNYGDKFKVLLDILDKYIEINEISKKAIIKKFSYEKLKELDYPDLNLLIENDEITIYLEYKTTTYKEKNERFNKAYVEARKEGILIDFPPSPLRIKMDAKLNVLDIDNE